MLGIVVLLYILMCTLILCAPCFKFKKGTRLTIVLFWSTAYFMWYLYSPIYAGLPTIIKSRDRPFVENGVVRNWGDTVKCKPKIYRAEKESDIFDAMNQKHLRVLGSTHSWSGLICSEYAILTLEYCNMTLRNNILEATAGCKISDIQIFLGERGRMLHGFGSIMGQTLAGASLTSLHGAQFDMFSTHILKMHAILANKTKIVVEGDMLRYWISSMGMLGIITDIHVQTFEHSSILREAKYFDFDTAMTFLHNDSIDGLAITGVLEQDTFYVETFSDIKPSNFTGLKNHSLWTAFAYDNIAQPLFLLFGQSLQVFNFMNLLHTEHSERIETNHAWSHMVGFTSGSGSEYSVPLHKCKDTLQKIRALDMFSHVYIRKLRASQDILTFAHVDSCCIEPYLFYTYNYKHDHKIFMEHVEKIVIEAGGKTHWGKIFHLSYGQLVPDEFKEYRKEIDPNGFFMNNFTTTLINGGTFNYKPVVAGFRSVVWLFAFWTAACVTLLGICLQNFPQTKAIRLFLSYLIIIFAWISMIIHDNNFVDGHRHGHNHSGIAWSFIWLLISILLLCLAVVDLKLTRLRVLIFLAAFIDSIIKITACKECTHGLSSLLTAATMLLYIGYNLYQKQRKPKYQLLG